MRTIVQDIADIKEEYMHALAKIDELVGVVCHCQQMIDDLKQQLAELKRLDDKR